jgi:hypothetical protein
MIRRDAFVALMALVLSGILLAASGCGGGTADAGQQASPSAASPPAWTRVELFRVMNLYLQPGHPAAIEFQVKSPELQIFALTQKPLTDHVLFLKGPGPAGSSEDNLTAVPMHTSSRSIAGFGYVFTAESVKPGPYRLVLKGSGAVFTVEVKQR